MNPSTTEPAGQPSIHYQRRWFYVLWCTLLLLSLGAYGLWEWPKRVEKPMLAILMRADKLPGGIEVQIWTGPKASWPGPGWDGQDARCILRPDAAGDMQMPPTVVPVGVRRWVRKGTVPRKTHDLLVFRFLAPGQAVRFSFFSLKDDWRQGLLKDGKRLFFRYDPEWKELSLDGHVPDGLR
jgi:hypothetical protein